MFKKLACFAVMLVVLFSLAACNDNLYIQIGDLQIKIVEQAEKIANLEKEQAALKNSELALYKTVAKYELDAYIKEKGEGNYSGEIWAEVQEIAAGSKTEIDIAANKPWVDAIVEASKLTIDLLQQRDSEITLFALKISTDNTYIKPDDIFSIDIQLINYSSRTHKIHSLYPFSRFIRLTDTSMLKKPPEDAKPNPNASHLMDIEKDSAYDSFCYVERDQLFPGLYVISFCTEFFINYGQQDEQYFCLESNYIAVYIE